ncbi:uroporphyrinogen-III synthase [Roseateles sp. YR242]|uniref:uroporphyrinogen-III synthase n=1 Tax=Roseateles sp. YR242 TaxID=1855305 RepID=UPI0008D70C33|nr:uroporphyrinogen-III synthase [Roseateles sp. YR242]SEK39505.1 uroporphyrinogen-III synthase [Roseateles sp. YR242]
MALPARLLLTRPLAQAQDWSGRLAALGVPTLAFPLIDIVPTDDAQPARQAWGALDRFQLVMFVSPNAVRHFFDYRPAGQPWPAGVLAATVGPGSAHALQAAGVPAARIVQPPADAVMLDSEHLWPEILRVAGGDWNGRAALMVRGDGGREWLGDRLREAGAAVEAISVYRRQCPVLDAPSRHQLAQALASPQNHIWLFSSSEAVGYLASMASPESGTDWATLRAITTHERIAERARALGLRHVVLVRPEATAVADAFRRLAGTPLESPT